MSGRSAERKPSPLFELACVLVRLDHIASLHRKRESQRRDSGGAFFPSGKEQPPLKSTITGRFPPSAPDYLHWTICIGDVVVGIGLNILSHGCGTAVLPQCAWHTLRTDFCADCTFFCGDTPLFAPPNADAQNAREIATLADQIDQPHNPPGRVVVVIPRICAFSLGRTTKKPQTARRVDALSGTVIDRRVAQDLTFALTCDRAFLSPGY
jgi:hypothetical protein